VFHKIDSSSQPIGVLPPKSSLGAFGALPDVAVLASLIESVRRASQGSDVAPAETPAAEVTAAVPCGGVSGTVHSVNSKIVLVQFFDGASHKLAKLVPGQVRTRVSCGGGFGLGLKQDFFIYLVKPDPEHDFSLTYVVNFSSPKKPEPKV
jgi:hypothetical protein